MRYLRYFFLFCVGVGLLVVALANREPVTVRLLPEEIGTYLGSSFAYQLPLFLIICVGIVAGLMIGFVWEWFREHKHRAEARSQRREKEKLAKEVRGLKQRPGVKDDVLALLDDAQGVR